MAKMWYELTPAEAVHMSLPHPDVMGSLTSDGDVCPWPWYPQQLTDVPLDQFHCPYCGEMVLAGVSHVDYRNEN